jgi:WD40-like Beta Propeller Repeat/Squalene-hopene cyclase C-terminal domain/Prenyltransferase and squalene oxidase repeat
MNTKSERPSGRLAVLWRILCSWYLPAAVGLVFLIGFVVWIFPRPIDRVVWADGQPLWGPAEPIEGFLPEGKRSLITPRLADGGGTLYFTYRAPGGRAGIYRSRLVNGQRERAEPVDELNSEADDLGPTLSRDGRQMFLFSNRPGGYGGFDLYVADREGDGWTRPRNLGPSVNSPGDEYDPALSPDGLTLYFASNRTPGKTKVVPAQAAPTGEAWARTLRAHPEMPTFDLYAARRSSLRDDWSAPEPLAELNSPANEGAPCVSPSGNYLYFASDRPARPGEAPNFDLYRARLVNGRFQGVENLGSGVNTAANETEPVLSSEGFTLLFSRGRDGVNGLYRSNAQEAYVRTEWDTSRLQAVAARWWQALLMTLFPVALLAGFVYSRGWLFKKATAARFVAASLIIHAMVVFLMWVVPLARTVVQHAEEIRVSEMNGHLFDDTLNPAQPDGRAVYEKVADPKTVESTLLPPLARQTTEPPSVPERKETLAPSLPIPVPRAATPDLQPPPLAREEPTLRPAPELPRRTRSQELAAAPPVAAEPGPAEVAPAPTQLVGPSLTPTRQEPTVPAPPPLEMVRRGPATPGRPAAIEVNPAAEKLPVTVQTPQSPPERRQPGRPAEAAQAPETVVVVVAKAPPDPKDLGPLAAPVSLGRREDSGPTLPPVPLTVEAPGRAGPGLQPVRVGLPNLQPLPPGDDSPRIAPLTRLPARDPSQVRRQPAVAAVPVDPGAEGAVSGEATQEKPIVGAQVALARPDAVLPEVPVGAPAKTANPRGPGKDSLIPGSVISKTDLQAVPARPEGVEIRPTNPLGNRMPRSPASGARVARADEGDMAAYLLRQGDVRKEAIDLLGGTKESEAAVERGLDWLAAHQNRDGSWSLQGFTANCKHPQCTAAATVASDTAGTGLSLLPFLAAGYTHKSGKHQQTVARGVKWLVDQQRADGGWLAAGDSKPMYGHGLAAIALCEAYGMTRDDQLRGHAQSALDFIARSQHPASGGWRYQPNTPGDTSVFGWQVMALKSGELAGLKVSPQALEGAKRWLKSVEANAPIGGQFGYQGPTPTTAMTAQGLLGMQLLGARRSDPRLVAGAEYLLKNLPQRNVDTSYYWYHATQVMYHMQGKYWKAWNERLRDMLVSTQVAQGSMAGSWDPVDAREKTGGRICSTALRLLMLEVYYRHLPLYQHLEK